MSFLTLEYSRLMLTGRALTITRATGQPDRVLTQTGLTESDLVRG